MKNSTLQRRLTKQYLLEYYGERIKLINKYRKVCYLYSVGKLKDESLYYEAIDFFSSPEDMDKDIEKMIINDHSRSSRLSKRVDHILDIGECPVFLTLTFRDDVLENTTQEDRRLFVIRFLKAQSNIYVANIDFGDSAKYFDNLGIERQGTHREHYHAIVDCKVDNNSWCLGNIDFVKIRVGSNSKAMSKYLCKLTNHAMKRSVQNNRVIYSRLPRK